MGGVETHYNNLKNSASSNSHSQKNKEKKKHRERTKEKTDKDHKSEKQEQQQTTRWQGYLMGGVETPCNNLKNSVISNSHSPRKETTWKEEPMTINHKNNSNNKRRAVRGTSWVLWKPLKILRDQLLVDR